MITVRECGVTAARVGVARLHRHLHRPPPSALVAFELLLDGWPIGWALVGRPASRVLQAQGWIEVTRVAVPSTREGGPRGGCSALYGACVRWAGTRRITTYTRDDEPGTSLRGAGWIPIARTAQASWSCPSRPRRSNERIGKVRWVPRRTFIGPEIPFGISQV